MLLNKLLQLQQQTRQLQFRYPVILLRPITATRIPRLHSRTLIRLYNHSKSIPRKSSTRLRKDSTFPTGHWLHNCRQASTLKISLRPREFRYPITNLDLRFHHERLRASNSEWSAYPGSSVFICDANATESANAGADLKRRATAPTTLVI